MYVSLKFACSCQRRDLNAGLLVLCTQSIVNLLQSSYGGKAVRHSMMLYDHQLVSERFRKADAVSIMLLEFWSFFRESAHTTSFTQISTRCQVCETEYMPLEMLNPLRRNLLT